MKCSTGFWIFLLLILLCLLAIPLHLGPFRVHVSPHLAERIFRNFTTKYNKTYEPTEFQRRLHIFTNALEDIVRLNMAHNATAHFGVTRYSDLNAEEFAFTHLNPTMSKVIGRRLESQKSKPPTNETDFLKVGNIHYDFPNGASYDYQSFYDPKLLQKNLNFVPLQVDWRKENVLRKVQKQGPCGACYAYTVIEMIEAQLAIHKNIDMTLSVQQLIDCARNGNDGCEGGDTCLLLEWLAKNKVDIVSNDEYPFSRNGTNQTCQIPANNFKSGQKSIRISDYTCESFIDNEERILEIVANYGPVTAAVNALGWQHYISGIIENDCDGTEEKLNHAVEIVGFDRSGSKPHYIVQNSWGTDFGESGFVKIAIGNNVCGIASQISMARLS